MVYVDIVPIRISPRISCRPKHFSRYRSVIWRSERFISSICIPIRYRYRISYVRIRYEIRSSKNIEIIWNRRIREISQRFGRRILRRSIIHVVIGTVWHYFIVIDSNVNEYSIVSGIVFREKFRRSFPETYVMSSGFVPISIRSYHFVSILESRQIIRWRQIRYSRSRIIGYVRIERSSIYLHVSSRRRQRLSQLVAKQCHISTG